MAYCCQGSGHGDATAEGQQGSCFQLKPEATSALLDPPGRRNPEINKDHREKALALDRQKGEQPGEFNRWSLGREILFSDEESPLGMLL